MSQSKYGSSEAQLPQSIGIAEQAIESESQDVGPIEKGIKPEELKEDSERARVLEEIAKLLSDCHGWSTNEYHQLAHGFGGDDRPGNKSSGT